jgi:hypothetical protein
MSSLLLEHSRREFEAWSVDALDGTDLVGCQAGALGDGRGIGKKGLAQLLIDIQPRHERFEGGTHELALRARPARNAARARSSWTSSSANGGNAPSRSSTTSTGCEFGDILEQRVDGIRDVVPVVIEPALLARRGLHRRTAGEMNDTDPVRGNRPQHLSRIEPEIDAIGVEVVQIQQHIRAGGGEELIQPDLLAYLRAGRIDERGDVLHQRKGPERRGRHARD